jgi:TetR/AcrR family transcriptional regulator, cholesterol catabolism regulator
MGHVKDETPPRMREEILAYKRDRILQEAVTLFYGRGFTATTLDDIAHELGVTKPFIYTHFRSKTDLLAAICRPTIEMCVAAASHAIERSGTPAERLRRFIEDFTDVILKRQANIAIFFREEKSLQPDDLRRIDQLRKEFDRLLTQLLQQGVDDGSFALRDVPLAALAIGGMISWVYTWHRPEGRLTRSEMKGRMAELVLQMVGVRQEVEVGA